MYLPERLLTLSCADGIKNTSGQRISWCWIDFQEFISRTSNLFFPISCVWGVGGIILYLLTLKKRWNSIGYIFVKCTVLGAVFEFLCGYLGEQLLEVTFWDYSGMPFHIGKCRKSWKNR